MKQEHRERNAGKAPAQPQTVPTPDAQALELARMKIAAAIAAKNEPQKVQAAPGTPEGQRVDSSPYSKESA